MCKLKFILKGAHTRVGGGWHVVLEWIVNLTSVGAREEFYVAGECAT